MSLSLEFKILLLFIPFFFLLLLTRSLFDLWFSIYGFLLHKFYLCKKKVRISDMESNGSDAGNRKYCKKKPMIVILRGTWLPDDDIKSSLSQLFSTCGKITEVYIPTCVLIESSNKYAFIYFTGEDAEEKADAEKKALLLNGTDVGGSKILVKVMPAKGPLLYVDMAEFKETQRITPRRVLVFVHHSWATLRIKGMRHEVEAKASALNGEVIDGWKVVVEPFAEEEEINFDTLYC